MDHEISCECGAYLPVSEGAAGAMLRCECGKSIKAPSLDELRRLSGRRPPSPPVATLIEYMIADRDLPTLRTCASCDTPTDDVADVTAECEKPWTTGTNPVVFAVAYAFIGLWAILLPRNRTEHGRYLTLHLPVRLCRNCRTFRTLVTRPALILAIAVVVIGAGIVASGELWGLILATVSVVSVVAALIVQIRRNAMLKRILAREPVYDRLMRDYPEANVTMAEDDGR